MVGGRDALRAAAALAARAAEATRDARGRLAAAAQASAAAAADVRRAKTGGGGEENGGCGGNSTTTAQNAAAAALTTGRGSNKRRANARGDAGDAFVSPNPSSSDAFPSLPSSAVYSATAGANNMGLRHFSLKVCEKVESKGLTTYNEVADELVRDLKAEAAAVEAAAPEGPSPGPSQGSGGAAAAAAGAADVPWEALATSLPAPAGGRGRYSCGSTAEADAGAGVRPIRRQVLGKQNTFDEKNIRRRVYDALNVLMAMDIITKEKKEILWRGLPLPGGAALASAAATAARGNGAPGGGAGATAEDAAAAASGASGAGLSAAAGLSTAARLAKLRAERDRLRAAADRGAAFVDELSRQATAFVNLIARNADAPAPLLRAAAAKAAAEAAEVAARAEGAGAAAGGEATAAAAPPPALSLPTPLPLPFILIAVRPDAAVEVQIAEDNSAAAFDFHDAPFRITGAEEVRDVLKEREREKNERDEKLKKPHSFSNSFRNRPPLPKKKNRCSTRWASTRRAKGSPRPRPWRRRPRP